MLLEGLGEDLGLLGNRLLMGAIAPRRVGPAVDVGDDGGAPIEDQRVPRMDDGLAARSPGEPAVVYVGSFEPGNGIPDWEVLEEPRHALQ